MSNQSQGLSEVSATDLSAQSAQVKLFYARRMTTLGILLSFAALLVLTWMLLSGGEVSTNTLLAYVFFILVLLINVVIHFKPYVRIGPDYVQVYGRRADFKQIVKYEEFSKGFIISFNAPPGEVQYPYDQRLLITFNRVRDEDKPKLLYALNEAMLKAKAKKEAASA